jgi:uncharacterized Tic20 family protein
MGGKDTPFDVGVHPAKQWPIRGVFLRGKIVWEATTMSDIDPGPAPETTPDTPPDDHERETRQWAMFIHFSILAGWVVPLAGIVVPVLLWQLKKDELPGIVPHAHVVLNWILSSLVYAAICFVLMFFIIGILGFVALALATVLFAILGGIKANEGELWEYPGTIIKFFD